MTTAPVRSRFAPSPTGSLHVGGVRTALYAMLCARHTGGRFILRIEDTDRARSTDEAAQGILADFDWLGIQRDEGPRSGGDFGPYLQSERLELYQRHAQQLLAAGHAYEAWETAAELGELRRAAQEAKENFRYRRHAYSDEDLARFRAEGRTPVLRFASQERDITMHDDVLGEVTVEAEVLDDFVILKADGWPTYHLAVVVDDHHMQIGLVLRGQEHTMNTHRHIQLYQAFGWDIPRHGHLPLIFNPDNSKMSKRDKAKAARAAARDAAKAAGHEKGDWAWLAAASGLDIDDVARFMRKKHDGVATAAAIADTLGVQLPLVEVQDFRRGGHLPEALINYMALLGWSPGDDREIMSVDDMAAAFTLDRVKRTPARFDLDKLSWMGGQYMQRLPIEVLLERLAQWLEVVDSPLSALNTVQRTALLEMYRPRARTFRDIEDLAHFFFDAPSTWTDKQVRKHLEKGDGWGRLELARAALDDVGRWEAPSLQQAVDTLCASTGHGLGKFAQPVRIAVTGTGVSPELFVTLAFLGREESLARIERFLATRPAPPSPNG